MEFEKMNHETIFIATDRFHNGYHPTLESAMPQNRSSIELNFYYFCPSSEPNADAYMLNISQTIFDPQHFIARAFENEFGFDDPKYLATVGLMYTALHIITMTKHIFCEETGTITSGQPQAIYAGIATKDMGSAFQIMFWIPEDTPDLKYQIHDGDVRGSGWNVGELAVEHNVDYVISVTSYAFTFQKIDYQAYCNSCFNDQYSEGILWDDNKALMESAEYTESVKGHTCTLTVAAEYYDFDGTDYLGNSNLHESIKFLA